MRIAIELSGHLRSCVAIPSILSRFKGHQIDWYIHTYSDDLYATNQSISLPKNSEAKIEKIFDYIEPIGLEIEENEKVLEEIKELAKKLKPKNKYDYSESVISCWRKRFKCSEMRRSFGKKYDLYIVTRPDLYWHSKRYFLPSISYNFLKKSCIPYEYEYDAVSDVAAIGNESFINYYSSLYKKISNIYYKNGKDINPHKILRTYLEETKYSKIIMGVTVIRPNNNRSPHLGLSGNRAHLSRFFLFSNCPSDIRINTVMETLFKEILIILRLKKILLKITHLISKNRTF